MAIRDLVAELRKIGSIGVLQETYPIFKKQDAVKSFYHVVIDYVKNQYQNLAAKTGNIGQSLDDLLLVGEGKASSFEEWVTIVAESEASKHSYSVTYTTFDASLYDNNKQVKPRNKSQFPMVTYIDEIFEDLRSNLRLASSAGTQKEAVGYYEQALIALAKLGKISDAAVSRGINIYRLYERLN